MRRTNTRYDVQKDIAIIDAIVSRHTAPALAAMGEGCPSPEPIFIIGLPRTGTTLVERILARHSEVFAAGELRDFAAEMVRLVGASSGGKASSHKLVELSLRLDAGELGRAYIDATRPRTGNTPRFTDKLPLNYLYAGLIHAALPKAKIVHVTRAPMDTCYAIYKTLFARAYPFSYDLADLGQYYLAYRRLMDHWRDALPGVVVDLRYEDLVSQPDESSRRLVAACDLAWELACLDFHSSLEASTTASAVQVRRPIYTSSVGKWRRFERQLEPLRALLARHGVDVT